MVKRAYLRVEVKIQVRGSVMAYDDKSLYGVMEFQNWEEVRQHMNEWVTRNQHVEEIRANEPGSREFFYYTANEPLSVNCHVETLPQEPHRALKVHV